MTAMSRTLNAGDVLTVFDYEYDDGSASDSKYFVVYGFHKNCVAGFLTTSQEKGGRKRNQGCHAGIGFYPWNFYFSLRGSPFSDGTWVILDIEWWEIARIDSWLTNYKAFWQLALPDDICRALCNCFKGSSCYAPVCEEYSRSIELTA